MTKTHEDVIEHHIRESEILRGIKITKFHLDYDKNVPVEELERELASLREKDSQMAKIDPLTMALAKIEHYESILKKIRKLCQSDFKTFATMSDDALKLKSDIFPFTDMGMWASQEHYIEFAKKRGVLK